MRLRKPIPIVLLMTVLLCCLVYAVPGDWNGEVSINGTAVSAGTEVTAVSNGTMLANTTTPSTAAGQAAFGDDFYILVFETTDGAALSLQVCGVEALSTTFSAGTHSVDLGVALQADGTYGCTCDAVCNGSNCVNANSSNTSQGVCSSNSYYCDTDGTCEADYGETSINCADCQGGGGGGGGGGSSGGDLDAAEVCVENWICGSWDPCEGSSQSRECADLNGCGTVTYKPAITRDCSEEPVSLGTTETGTGESDTSSTEEGTLEDTTPTLGGTGDEAPAEEPTGLLGVTGRAIRNLASNPPSLGLVIIGLIILLGILGYKLYPRFKGKKPSAPKPEN